MSIKTYLKGHSGVATFLVILVVIFAVIGGRLATKKPAEESASNTKRISVVDVSTFRDDLSTVSVEGVVESASQVDIKSQVSAPVSRVYVSIGDNVSVGQTIVEFQNADIRAQLEQARANLSLAEGQYSVAGVSTGSAEKATIDRLRDSYTKAEDAFTGQIGQFLYSTNPNARQLQELITDSKIINELSIKWSTTQGTLRTYKQNVDVLTDNSSKEQITAVLGVAQTTLSTMNSFLDTLSAALVNAGNGATQSDLALISSWKGVVSAARATNNGSISALTQSGVSLSSSDAQISAAQAGVRALEAQLAKTIIKSPISGTIAALPFRTGELATPGQLITTVIGSGGLQIKAFASSEDVDRITKNAVVTVDGRIPGIVTSVAPSVNQLNKKVEVKITVPAVERVNLVVGQSVQAKIQAKAPAVTSNNRIPNYILPIQNVKIIPDAAYVYTVNDQSKIVKHEVVLGEVKGDFVEIKSGITEGMKIVSPVYELEEGEVVTIQ